MRRAARNGRSCEHFVGRRRSLGEQNEPRQSGSTCGVRSCLYSELSKGRVKKVPDNGFLETNRIGASKPSGNCISHRLRFPRVTLNLPVPGPPVNSPARDIPPDMPGFSRSVSACPAPAYDAVRLRAGPAGWSIARRRAACDARGRVLKSRVFCDVSGFLP